MADKKVTELSAITNLSGDDLLLVVNDPSGTPASNKVTVTNLFANVVPNVVHKGTVVARGNTTFSGTTMTVSANATYSGTLTVSGTLVESGVSTRSGVQVFNGNTIHNDSLKANGGIVLSSAVTSGGSNIIGSNGKINANNAISAGTITDEMLYATPIGNTVARTLISDRMQVANTTLLVNDRMQVANTTTLVNDRLQVANAAVYITVANAEATFANSYNGIHTGQTRILEVSANNVAVSNSTGFGLTQYPSGDLASSNTTTEGLIGSRIFYTSNNLYITIDNNTTKRVPLHSGVRDSQSNDVFLTDNSTSPRLVFTVTNNGTSAYRFTGAGAATTDNETLYLYKGFTYAFNNQAGNSHPFQIRNSSGGSAFSNGVSGDSNTIVYFTVPHAQIANLVYQCTNHAGMLGTLVIR